MTSKLSVHISSGRRDNFGTWLRSLATAGNPPLIIFSVNENISNDIKQYSPTTQWIYRYQSAHFNRLPGGMFTGDPRANARNWMTGIKENNLTLMQNWALNTATWFDPLNEPAPGTVEQAQWLNAWMLEALEIAHQAGFKLALFSFPTGSPDYPLWAYLLPALRLGKKYGAILSLHAYSDDGLANKSNGIYTQSVIHNALRHRKVYADLPEDARLPFIYSEASGGNGYDTGLSGSAWVNDLVTYAKEVYQDAYLQSICAYQLGGNESNCYTVLPTYSTGINAVKWAEGSNEPIEPIKIESVDNLTIPPEVQIVDSGLHIWKLGATLQPAGYPILKDGVQFAGGYGLTLLYYKKRIYTRNAQNQWYVAGDVMWVSVSGDPRTSIVKAEGIDVSHYQGTIDWSKVRASGKAFAFIKATEGSNFIDSVFATNWKNAKAVGLLRGAYHFYRFSATPQSQVDRFLGVLGSDLGELPPVVDVEDTQFAHPSANDLKIFVDLVQQRTGRKPIVYTARWYWTDSRWGSPVTWARSCDLWTASYTSAPIIPTDWTSYRFWQYTSSGSVPGIVGAVDLDQYNGTLDELKATYIIPPFRLASPVTDIPFRVTDPFNSPRTYANGKHEGVDIDCYDDTTGKKVPIRAAQNGIVAHVGTRTDTPSYGTHIWVRHPWGSLSNRYYTLYAHLDSVVVQVGQSVTTGQVLGTGGASGTAAVHLHFGLYDTVSGLTGYVASADCVTAGMPTKVVDPLPYIDAPARTVILGVHARADGGDIPASDVSTLQLVSPKVTGYKFLTSCSQEHYSTVINSLHIPAVNCLTRLFYDARGVTTRPTPQQFVDLMRGGINTAWSFGVRWYELLNETNVFTEWPKSWGDATGFTTWAKEVIGLLRAGWSGIKIISPGLAPAPDTAYTQNTDTWIQAFETGGLFNACDVVGVHNYWRNRAYMLNEIDGLNFHRYLAHTTKPIIISEASNNQTADTDLEKGKQYRDYAAYLSKNEPRVERVYVFVMSASDVTYNNSHETWVRGNVMTDIPRGIMS